MIQAMQIKRLSQDRMTIEIDVPIAMADGVVLRADVFHPSTEGRYPVILSYGPYGKGLHFADGYKTAWDIMAREHPDPVAGTSNATPTGRWWTRRSGCPTAMWWCGWTTAGPVARPAFSAAILSARRTTSTTASIGRHPALVEREGRAQQHFLLCHQPVARRGVAAAASGGDLRLGGLR